MAVNSSPYSLLITHYSLFIIHYCSFFRNLFSMAFTWRLAVGSLRVAVDSSAYSLLITHYSLLIIHYSLLLIFPKPVFDGFHLRLSQMRGLFQYPEKLGDFLF